MTTSMDLAAARALFQALAVAGKGKAGRFDLDAANPDGINTLVVLAIDQRAWLAVEPALRTAGVEVERLGRPA